MNIFVSYRHDDSKKFGQEIHRVLEKEMGHTIFLDEEKIGPGRVYTHEIDHQMRQSDVVLAIIGQQWLRVTSPTGSPRIQEPNDVLRNELQAALTLRIPIVPILIDGATMPTRDQLPVGLKRLEKKTAYTIRPEEDVCVSIKKLEEFLRDLVENPGTSKTETPEYVLTVGGANGERTLELNGPIRRGEKQSAKSQLLYGGSGFNYAAKLVGYGIPVLPVLSVGQDELGMGLQSQFIRLALDSGMNDEVLDWASATEFFVPNFKTTSSTIIIERKKKDGRDGEGDKATDASGADEKTVASGKDKAEVSSERTILKDKADDDSMLSEHLASRIEKLKESRLMDQIKAVVIGHIEADRKKCCHGKCTVSLIETFQDLCPIFANLGNSQIELGFNFWEKHLNRLDVLQLNLDEMKRLFAVDGVHVSLREILDRMRLLPLYTVVTLDRFGAICVGHGSGQYILAWPSEVELVDSTGTGDAFISGMVARLCKNGSVPEKQFAFGEMLEAIDEGRYWAAKACGHLGGASECPEQSVMEAYKTGRTSTGKKPDTGDLDSIRRLIWVLDRAYG